MFLSFSYLTSSSLNVSIIYRFASFPMGMHPSRGGFGLSGNIPRYAAEQSSFSSYPSSTQAALTQGTQSTQRVGDRVYATDDGYNDSNDNKRNSNSNNNNNNNNRNNNNNNNSNNNGNDDGIAAYSLSSARAASISLNRWAPSLPAHPAQNSSRDLASYRNGSNSDSNRDLKVPGGPQSGSLGGPLGSGPGPFGSIGGHFPPSPSHSGLDAYLTNSIAAAASNVTLDFFLLRGKVSRCANLVLPRYLFRVFFSVFFRVFLGGFLGS